MLNNDWKDIVTGGGVGEEFTSIDSMKTYKIQVNLEILEGCSYMCPGCFVKRRGNWNPKSIATFHSLAYELKDRDDIVLDDIVIGPTDFYGAENLIDIINNPRLADAILMMPEDNRNIQHNCSILGSLSEKDIQGKIKAIEESPLGKVVEGWDVQIALDLNRLMNDQEYLIALDERVETFKNSSLNFEISMATNIVQGVEDILYPAIDFVRSKYETVIEVLPSVVRSFNHSAKHGDKLFEWNDMLSRLAVDPHRFKNKFHFLQGDVSHKAFHYSVVSIYHGDMYLSPFIYENAQIHTDDFKVDVDGNIVDSILNKKNKIVNDQIEQSSDKECGSCKYLNICANRMVPMIMDTVFDGREECILNKDVIGLFDDEVYHGNSY
jgi:radical SAM protein with 4Fe4S-binding SPASM domain